MEESNKNRLPAGRYLSFGFAGASSMILFQIVSSYQTVFYTDVLGITAGAIAAIMLISKIWDAINDPLMGVIAERTRSKWGRFRPWLLWMAPVTAITFVLTFFVWPGSIAVKAVLAGVCYILFGMAYTASGIPMQSLPTVMTRNMNERVSLYTVFGIASNIGAIIVSAVFTPALLKVGQGNANSPKAYTVVCTIIAVIAFVLLLAAFKGTEEVIQPDRKTGSISVKDSLKIFVKDRNLLCLLGGMILALVGVFGRVGTVVYYYMYVLERVDLVSICITLTTIGTLVPYLFLPIILKRVDVKKVMAISCAICAASCVLLYFANGNTSVVLLGTFLVGAGNWLTLCSQTMVAQIIDDNELKNGFRTEGILVSVISFSTKFSSAIGSAIGVALISMTGYIPNEVQTTSVKSGMNAVINLGPAAMYALAIVFFLLIKMTNKTAEKNAERLSEKTDKGSGEAETLEMTER